MIRCGLTRNRSVLGCAPMRCKVGSFVAISLLAVWNLSSIPSRAQAGPSEQASALLERGVDLRVDKRDAEALELFEKANALSPSPRAMAQIGLAEQALGRWVAAEQHLSAALASKDDPWIRKFSAALEDGLRVVRSHLASLQVEVNVTGAEVWVNGVVVATTPMREPVRVPAATAVIAVRAPGHVSAEVRRNIEAGQLIRETITLVATQPPRDEQHGGMAPPGPARPGKPVQPKADTKPIETAGGSSTRTWGYVAGGVGLAGFAATGVLAAMAVSKTSDLPQGCNDDPAHGCTPSQGDDINTARGYARIANVTFGVGILGVGLGTLLLLQAPAPTEHAGRVQVLPTAGAGYGGLDIGGIF